MAEDKKVVVCIEDEPEMIDLVKLILGRKGFELDTDDYLFIFCHSVPPSVCGQTETKPINSCPIDNSAT